MPQDNAADMLGLEKNELEEFQGCMEERYEWIPQETKASTHGDNSKGHGKGQKPNLPLNSLRGASISMSRAAQAMTTVVQLSRNLPYRFLWSQRMKRIRGKYLYLK